MIPSLPVASKFNRNENHLMLLAVIAKMDEERIDTDVEKLAELGKFFKTHVEYMLDNLIEEGLVEIQHDEDKSEERKVHRSDGRDSRTGGTPADDSSTSEQSGGSSTGTLTIRLPREKRLVDVHDFVVTRTGKALLEEKKKELAKLSVAMQRLYNKRDKEELYKAIFWNREWIAFMLYTGVLTTDYLTTMMKMLGLDMYRLSMTEVQQELSDLGIDPGLLSMGLVFVHPLLAIASYILSMVTMDKLEEKWKKKVEEKGKVEGEIYIPRID